MFRSHVLREIHNLDPEKDHQRIVFLSSRYDFPFDTTRSLEFALFRTYCIPSIGALLDKTGEFAKRAQLRYDDTDIIVSELMEWGYDSERGRLALQRMNQIHGRFQIPNDDFLYVLSTFVFEPIRWNSRFGWRPFCRGEKLAHYWFWREVGQRMHITDIPEEYESFERFNVEYERNNYRYSEPAHRVGMATRELFVGWTPRVLHPLVRSGIHALLDDLLIESFGFPRPSPVMRQLVRGGLKARAFMLRWLPHRRKPLLRTEMKHPSHPGGYRLEEIGPPQRA